MTEVPEGLCPPLRGQLAGWPVTEDQQRGDGLATLIHHGQRVLALVLVCALGMTMIAPTVGANADPDQAGLSIGAQAMVAFTGGAGVLQRSTPGYDGAVVASLAEGETVSITEGPLSDANGQVWFGVAAMATGYVPGFTLAPLASAPATDPVVTETVPAETIVDAAATVATTEEPIVSGESVGDTNGALLPGTAMVTDTNGDGARCRTGANYASATIVVVPEGTVVTIAGPVEAASWQPIICGVSQYGYVHTDFVTYALGEEPIDVVAPSVAPTAVGATDAAPTAAVPTEVISTATASVTPTATGTAVAAETDTATAEAMVASDEAESADDQITTLAVGSSSWGTGYVSGTNGDGVRCRSAASYSASTILVLSEGSAVTMRGAAQGEWQPVSCGGQSGFAHVSFIRNSSTSAPSSPSTGGATSAGGASTGSATITGTNGNGLNCRATASYTGSVIAIFSEGSSVTLRGAAQGDWQPATCAGMGGYVNIAFISSGGSSTTPPSTGADSGSANPGGATTGTATVSGTNGDGLRCRASASYSGAVLMVMPEGSSVTLNGSAQGEWQPVQCGSQLGFAFASFLGSGGGSTPPASTAPSKAPPAAPSAAPSTASGNGSGKGASLVGGNARVTAALNLRYEARYSAGVAAVAPAGTVVVVTDGPSDGFYRVDWDGLAGWMHGDYLVATDEAASDRGGSAPAPTSPSAPSKPTTPSEPTAPSSGSGSALVNYAMQYVGYPYVWAGEGPYGFDCSGFTMYVVQNVLGKNITHDMAVQISMGTPVGRGSLQPGDLIFFQNTFQFGLSHVGIYIGNGQFVHAENEQTGVRVSDLNSDYYSSRWYGAARY